VKLSAGSTSSWRHRFAAVPWWGWIVGLVAIEALVVLLLVPTSWSQAVGNGDGAEYQRYAFNLLHHGVFSEAPVAPFHPGVVRSPGYPAFLAALEWIGGRHVLVIQFAQFALLAITSILVGFIGRALARPAVGNLAAAMCATYLPFLGFATVFLTEMLTTCLLTAAVALLVLARRTRRRRHYVAIGLVLAAASYVRPECSLVAVPIALVLLLEPRSPLSFKARAAATAFLVAALVLPLVPWLARDASVTGGRLVPMEADGGVALLASVDQYDGVMSEGFADVKVWDAQVARVVGVPAAATEGIQAPVKQATAWRQVQIDKQEQSTALRLFKSLSPGTVLSHIPRRVVALWGVGDETPPASAGAWWHHLAQLQYVVLLILGLVGVGVRRRRLLSDWPLWLVPVVLTLTHLVFPVEARYTLPARPMLMVYASVGALGAGSLIRRSRVLRSAWPRPRVDVA
jgi:4-amino-4-deoxy-L-arabinose transferase-like glycosyltransferase